MSASPPNQPSAEFDPRLNSPSAQRNRGPILEVLSGILPNEGIVLEVASGTGEHASWFAQHLSPLIWQPSDPDPAMRASINSHAEAAQCRLLMPAIHLDVLEEEWPLERADAIVCINMLHIAPWAACEGLMAGASRILLPGAILFLYGPYKRAGRHTAESNAAFDASLRERNPEWGVRDLEEVVALAAEYGLELVEVVDMPANNFSLVFRRI